jgi:hypothetical protein
VNPLRGPNLPNHATIHLRDDFGTAEELGRLMLRDNRTSNRVVFPSLFALHIPLPTFSIRPRTPYAVGGRSSIHLCRGLRCCTIIVTGLLPPDGAASASESANACRFDVGRTGQGRTVEAEAATVTTEPTKVSAKRKETRERLC